MSTAGDPGGRKNYCYPACLPCHPLAVVTSESATDMIIEPVDVASAEGLYVRDKKPQLRVRAGALRF